MGVNLFYVYYYGTRHACTSRHCTGGKVVRRLVVLGAEGAVVSVPPIRALDGDVAGASVTDLNHDLARVPSSRCELALVQFVVALLAVSAVLVWV